MLHWRVVALSRTVQYGNYRAERLLEPPLLSSTPVLTFLNWIQVVSDHRITMVHDSANMSAIYDTLSSASSIRLLGICCRDNVGRLACIFETFDIDSAPSYDALSYSWGPFVPVCGKGGLEKAGVNADSIKLVEINCNSRAWTVTRNLYEALDRISKGFSVDVKDAIYEKTALHWAAERGREDIVRTLLSHGANVLARDMFGETPLHYAAENGHLPCCEATSGGSVGAECAGWGRKRSIGVCRAE